MRPHVNTRHGDEYVELRVKLDHGTPTTRSTGHANLTGQIPEADEIRDRLATLPNPPGSG